MLEISALVFGAIVGWWLSFKIFNRCFNFVLRKYLNIEEAEYITQYPTFLCFMKQYFPHVILGIWALVELQTEGAILIAASVIITFSVFKYLSKKHEKASKVCFLIIAILFLFKFLLNLIYLSWSTILLCSIFPLATLYCYKKYQREKLDLSGVLFWEKEIISKICILNGIGASSIFILFMQSGGYIQSVSMGIILLCGSLLYLWTTIEEISYRMLIKTSKESIFFDKISLQKVFLDFYLSNEKNIVIQEEIVIGCIYDYNAKISPNESSYTCRAFEDQTLCEEFIQSKLYDLIKSYLSEIDSIFDAAIQKNKICVISGHCFNIQEVKEIIKNLCVRNKSFNADILLEKINLRSSFELLRSELPDTDVLLLINIAQYPVERAYEPSGRDVLYIALQHVTEFQICDGCHCLIHEPYESNGEVFCSKECADFQVECDEFYANHRQTLVLASNNQLSTDGHNQKKDFTLAETMGMGIGIAEIAKITEETKMFSTPRGHGFAAEQANNLYDQLTGKDAKVIGGDNLKNGADRLVNGQLIQSKYCKTGSKCIAECFEGDRPRYVDKHGRPMQIEVPSDKYADAVKAMENRIKRGQVPGVDDPKAASKIVRKGNFTYEQAKNIAKAGTIESITFDAVKGVQVGIEAGATTFIISLGVNLWNGKDRKAAVRDAAYAAKDMAVRQGSINVIQGQATKSSILKEGTKVITSLVEKTAKSVGLSNATVKELSSFFKGNLVTVTVTVVVFSIGDFYRFFDNQITLGTLVKNIGKTAATVAGTVAGGIAGGAVATAAATGLELSTAGLGSAGLGTLLTAGPASWMILGGATVGAYLGGKLLSWLGEKLFGDDEEEKRERQRQEQAEAKRRIEEMYPILKMYFAYLAEAYLLTEQECQIVLKKLDDIGIQNFLLSIYEQENRVAYLNIVLRPLFIDVSISRKFVASPKNYEFVNEAEEILAS